MRHTVTVLLVGFVATSAAAQTQQVTLGNCPLELGGRIENCRVAYRTFGKLSSDRRNAILIPTWFASRAEAWLPFLGSAGVVDTTDHFVVVVESLGAGSSSSPSNSDSQQGGAFPELTVGDMVEACYRLAKEYLRLPELYAVVGISLGGLEAFEWGVTHPDYVQRIVPIHAAPRQGVYGRAIWELITRTAEDGVRGLVSLDSTAMTLARFGVFVATSPADANRRPVATYPQYMTAQARTFRAIDLNEWAWQGRAILRHDISRRVGGDMSEAAKVWRAKTLVVVATQDHSVDPEPALEFARLIHADTLVLSGSAGHSSMFVDSTAKRVVRQFLKR